MNAQAVAKVVEEEFGPIFQAAGCKIIFGDNDKKLHSVVTELFCESIFELSVSKMLGQSSALVADRKNIVEKIDLDLDYCGGFPVNSPDCMVLDQSVDNTWKNLEYGGFNKKFQARKPSRRTNGGFINNVHSSWNEM